jgi:hypothetical protein
MRLFCFIVVIPDLIRNLQGRPSIDTGFPNQVRDRQVRHDKGLGTVIAKLILPRYARNDKEFQSVIARSFTTKQSRNLILPTNTVLRDKDLPG